jgi:site-specific DNA-methyltransferase (adenine-specific)
MCTVRIHNEKCEAGENRLPEESVKLGIFDPPFGIGEAGFNKHYKRDSSNVIKGYCEAPDNYELWTHEWMAEAKRVLHPDGSIYVIIGHTNLRHVLNVAHRLGFVLVNHVIWKYNFGVNTTKKFVTSHYHVLFFKKSEKSNITFNTYCRFGQQEKTSDGGSRLYQDMEDVFTINKDYAPGEKKNQNKLPTELIEKLILYSSNPNDVVCDFFMGNFTTAYAARSLGRKVYGYELNKESYNYHMPLVKTTEFGGKLKTLPQVINIQPPNQGKSISPEESHAIFEDYQKMVSEGLAKKTASQNLQTKYGRGRFSIKNILDKHIKLTK